MYNITFIKWHKITQAYTTKYTTSITR